MIKRSALFLVIAGILSVAGAIGLLAIVTPNAVAAPAIVEDAAGRQLTPPQQIDNAVCLGCHTNSDLTKNLYNGDTWSLVINPDDHAKSVHGQAGLACVQCHTNFGEAHLQDPLRNPGFNAADRRDASLQLYTLCQTCHLDQYEKANDSVHSRALAAGNRSAAICTDCHTAHAVRRLTNPATRQLLPDARLWVPQTCAQCHSAIYDKYKDSVHGEALTEASNLDVPTCIDCHGVHNIGDPTTAAFRLKSPEICARCHTNPDIMDKYGISTQVLNTYVADFHGTTVTLFEKQSPDAETNKPVCFDCHGVHDIKRVDDPEKGLQVRQNLLVKCQACHPNATSSFSEAWLSHYIPSQDKYPLVYFVNVFYQIFIPGVLGGMAVIVALDVSWRVRTRLRKPKPAAPSGTLLDQSVDFEKIESSRPLSTPTGGPEIETPPPHRDAPQSHGDAPQSEIRDTQSGEEAKHD